MKGVGGGLFEAEALVPTAGGLVLGVDEHQTDAELLGCLVRAQHRVLEKRPAEALPLVGEVNGQPGKQDGRKRPSFWLALARPSACILWRDLGGGERVVPDDPLAIG